MLNDINVLVTDLDHTLLHPETEDLPERVPDLLREWMKNGNHWVIATGRRRDHLEHVLEALSMMPDYYITRSRYIHAGNSSEHNAFEEWNQAIQELAEKEREYAGEWLPLLQEWAMENGFPVDIKEYYAVFDRVEHAEASFHFLSERVSDDFKVLRNHEFVIAVPRGTGKGRCVKKLSEINQWNESEIFCIGDGMNDANMLDGDYDFRKATVSNAEPKLKQLVRTNGGHVLNDEGGTAIHNLLHNQFNEG